MVVGIVALPLSIAFAIALLGAIESLLSAIVGDGMIGGRHRPNVELVARGVANMASPLFAGILLVVAYQMSESRVSAPS